MIKISNKCLHLHVRLYLTDVSYKDYIDITIIIKIVSSIRRDDEVNDLTNITSWSIISHDCTWATITRRVISMNSYHQDCTVENK